MTKTNVKKPPRIQWGWSGVQWGWHVPAKYPERADYSYYFYWWNWLPRGSRYVGTQNMYYDGWNWTFGFWFFNWSWCTAWAYRFYTPSDD